MSTVLAIAWGADGDEAVLVSAEDAAWRRLDDACEELPLSDVVAIFRVIAGRDMEGVRLLADECGFLGVAASRLRDDVVRAMVESAIERRELRALRRRTRMDSLQHIDARLRDQSRLVEQIALQARNGLRLGRGRYELATESDVPLLLEKGFYEVVSRPDAERVIDALVSQPDQPQSLGDLLRDAKRLLSSDWRRPQRPRGLVLLRRIADRPMARVGSQGPALTPSELRAQAEKDWIEICVEDDDGEPCSDVVVEIELPDGRKVTSSTGEDGLVHLEGIPKGNCKVRLPKLDAAAWGLA